MCQKNPCQVSDILVSRYDLSFIFYLPGENCSSDLLESKNLEISELFSLLLGLRKVHNWRIIFLAKYEFKMNWPHQAGSRIGMKGKGMVLFKTIEQDFKPTIKICLDIIYKFWIWILLPSFKLQFFYPVCCLFFSIQHFYVMSLNSHNNK